MPTPQELTSRRIVRRSSIRFRNRRVTPHSRNGTDALRVSAKTSSPPRRPAHPAPSLYYDFYVVQPNAYAPPFRHKREWFQSKRFRNAVSSAVNRRLMVRLVYRGFGTPAGGPVSPQTLLVYKESEIAEL